jgi:hypothetical protein
MCHVMACVSRLDGCGADFHAAAVMHTTGQCMPLPAEACITPLVMSSRSFWTWSVPGISMSSYLAKSTECIKQLCDAA